MVLHNNLSGTNLHVPQDHTHVESEITDLQAYLTEAAADLLYAPIGATNTFLGLTDTPSAFIGDMLLRVNSAGNAIELENPNDVIGNVSSTDGTVDVTEAAAVGTYSTADLSIATELAKYLPLAGGSLTGNLFTDSPIYCESTIYVGPSGSYRNAASVDSGDVKLGDQLAGCLLQGDQTRPSYVTGAVEYEMALLSDINNNLPHYSKGSGAFNAIAYSGLALAANGTAKVSARDILISLQGGVSSPSYTFYLSKLGDPSGWGSGNSTPSDEYVTYTSGDAGINVLYWKVSDGTTELAQATIAITVS